MRSALGADDWTYRPDIEGLRGIAILLVIAFHADVTGFTGGFVGVDVFFVLSGYLISGLLCQEIFATGRLDFRRFYARRARRLLPAAALVLVCIAAIGSVIYSPIEQKGFARTAVSTALYMSNVWFGYTSTDYLAADEGDNPLLHTWSLAVEEQFYFVWPLLILVIVRLTPTRGLDVRLAINLLAVAAMSFGLCVWFTRVSPEWAFFGSVTRAWEFALGACAAALAQRALPPRFARALGWAGLLLVAAPAVWFDRSTPYPGIAALVPVIGTVAILSSGAQTQTGVIARLLRMQFLQRLGRLSYSWYLWHWPLLIFAASLFGELRVAEKILCSVAALALSALTYATIENPVRRSKRLVAHTGAALAVAASLTIVALGAGALWLRSATAASIVPQHKAFTSVHLESPRVYKVGCHLGLKQLLHPACVFGDGLSDKTVVLFGDSHAAQWFPAIERIAVERGWRLVSLTKSACPVASVSVENHRLRRLYRECDRWREAMLERIVRLEPAAVILASYSAVYVNEARSASTSLVSSSQWTAGLRQTLVRLSRTGSRIVFMGATPTPGFSIPICLSRTAWAPWRNTDSCGFQRDEAVGGPLSELEQQVAAEFPTVTWLDLTDHICGETQCEPVLQGQIVYKDRSHLSTAFSTSMAPVLAARLDPLVQ
jgi:peptidoglycan/LPS O-acetylase OafA/YrhL